MMQIITIEYANAFVSIVTGLPSKKLVTKIQSKLLTETEVRRCHFFSTTNSKCEIYLYICFDDGFPVSG
jgi:hypothetical protein